MAYISNERRLALLLVSGMAVVLAVPCLRR
jgi:hypothetical protein